jgi:aminoglycoside phosphotransferase (APT) family kinase protein
MEGPEPADVLRALGAAAPERADRVAGGMDTALWRVEVGGRAFALRLFRAEQAAVAEREVAAMAAAAAGGVPVPRVEARGVWQERPALLLEWCSGRPLFEELARRPRSVWRLGRAFGRAQARLHRVNAPPGLPSWLEWHGAPGPEVRAALEGAAPRSDALLHLDYHPLNVLVDGRRVTAVIDWANARAGDPRADLARTLTILRLSPVPPRFAPVVGVMVAGWRGGYEAEAGPVGEMAPFYAWAADVMARDLGPRAGRAGLPEAQLERIRDWGARWRG